MKALIGHTGFIGSMLKQQIKFHSLFNSSNIQMLKTQEYDEIYSSNPYLETVFINDFFVIYEVK